MRKKNNLLIALFTILMMVPLSCGKHEKDTEKTTVSVVGCWELTGVETKSAKVGEVVVDVYLDFAATGSYTIYQKIGEGWYTKFTGTYTVTDNQLSGSYSGNTKTWGPYVMELEENSLVLYMEGGKERDAYKRIDAVPGTVTSMVY